MYNSVQLCDITACSRIVYYVTRFWSSSFPSFIFSSSFTASRCVPICTCSNIIIIIICMTGTSVRRISEIPHKMHTTCLLASRTHYTIRTRFNNTHTHTRTHMRTLLYIYCILDPSVGLELACRKVDSRLLCPRRTCVCVFSVFMCISARV